MPKDTLNEREFELVNIIGAKLGSNQRDLSRIMDLSLGMVNMLVRRLISKGYIRINQLDKRKVEYNLTPKGITHKMQQSMKYTVKTIHSIGVIKNRAIETLEPLVNKGERKFYILGESDFAILVEMVLRELCKDDYEIDHIEQIPSEKLDGILLICREDIRLNGNVNKENCINLVKELAKDYELNGSKVGEHV